MSGASSFAVRFADWATSNDSAFSTDDLAQARLCFADTIACMLAGSGESQTLKARHAMQGTAPGSVAPFAIEAGLSMPAAALVNGTAAHALDFDDYEQPGSTHPSAPVIGALLALTSGDPVPYSTLQTAYLTGYEAIVRLGQVLGYGHYMAGWHATSTIGTIGSAAACAKALDLPTDQFANAVSLACSMAAGLKGQFGSDAKALHAGFAARAGLEAALLASSGLAGSHDIFEAPAGFVSVFDTDRIGVLQDITSRLGRVSAMSEYPVLRKPWPSCAYTHRAIEAALELAARPDVAASDVETVTVKCPAPYAEVAGIEEPVDGSGARFSLRWCVASALHDGIITPASFSREALADTGKRALMHRVTIVPYDPGPDVEDMSPAHPDTVDVLLKNGERHTDTVAQVKGGPAAVLTGDDICAKFISCGGTKAGFVQLADGPADAPVDISVFVQC